MRTRSADAQSNGWSPRRFLLENVESPRPDTFPRSSAAASALSSTMPPRAQFTITTPSFIAAISRAPMSPCVVRSQRRVHGDPVALADHVRGASPAARRSRGSAAPHERVARDHAHPERARPNRDLPPHASQSDHAERLSRQLDPLERLALPSPAGTEACARGISRATASMSAMVCSAVETVLLRGELITTMPRCVAAATSMLSTPTPARPMNRRRFPRARSPPPSPGWGCAR